MNSPTEQFQSAPLNAWHRHAVVRAISAIRGVNMLSAAQIVYPNSAATALKAATNPASTGGWGQQLSATGVGEFLQALRPNSASSVLLDQALRISLGSMASIALPRTASDWILPAWVAEGGAIPVDQGSFGQEQLGPMNKLAAIAVLSDELSTATGETAEQVIGALMLEATGRALDAAIFSTTAAGATRPAGLLNGVSAVTATSGGGAVAMLTDLKALVAPILAGGGGGSIVIFANPIQALALNALAANGVGYPVIPAPSIAVGTIIAVDVAAIAWSGEFPPEVNIARQAALHMDDAATALSATGTPNTVAAPIRSTFQTNTLALRLLLPITWVKRSATSVQYLTGATW